MASTWPLPVIEVDGSETFYQLIGKLRGQFSKVFEHAWEHPNATASASYVTDLLSQTNQVINILAKQKVADDKAKLEKEQQRLERDDQLLDEKALRRPSKASARQGDDHSGPNANLNLVRDEIPTTHATTTPAKNIKEESNGSAVAPGPPGSAGKSSNDNSNGHSARDRFGANSWPDIEKRVAEPMQATTSFPSPSTPGNGRAPVFVRLHWNCPTSPYRLWDSERFRMFLQSKLSEHSNPALAAVKVSSVIIHPGAADVDVYTTNGLIRNLLICYRDRWICQLEESENISVQSSESLKMEIKPGEVDSVTRATPPKAHGDQQMPDSRPPSSPRRGQFRSRPPTGPSGSHSHPAWARSPPRGGFRPNDRRPLSPPRGPWQDDRRALSSLDRGQSRPQRRRSASPRPPTEPFRSNSLQRRPLSPPRMPRQSDTYRPASPPPREPSRSQNSPAPRAASSFRGPSRFDIRPAPHQHTQPPLGPSRSEDRPVNSHVPTLLPQGPPRWPSPARVNGPPTPREPFRPENLPESPQVPSSAPRGPSRSNGPPYRPKLPQPPTNGPSTTGDHSQPPPNNRGPGFSNADPNNSPTPGANRTERQRQHQREKQQRQRHRRAALKKQILGLG